MKSDSSTSSAGSEGSGSASKEPIVLRKINSRGVYAKKGETYTLLESMGRGIDNIPLLALGASGVMTSTNTPAKSIPRTSEKKTMLQPTLGESMQKTYQTSISFVQDFHARRFQLPEKGKVSKRLVARFSSRYAELRMLKDLASYSSKTLEDSLTMTEDELSRSSFKRWMTWGTGSNGRYLTANIIASPRTGSGSSLSDILEDEVDEKYFLSNSQVESLMAGIQKSKLHSVSRALDTLQGTTEE